MTKEESISVIAEIKRVLTACGWYLDPNSDFPDGKETHLRMSRVYPKYYDTIAKETWEIFYHGSEDCIDAYYTEDWGDKGVCNSWFECCGEGGETGLSWARSTFNGGPGSPSTIQCPSEIIDSQFVFQEALEAVKKKLGRSLKKSEHDVFCREGDYIFGSYEDGEFDCCFEDLPLIIANKVLSIICAEGGDR